jgi:hypothetical protein
MISPTPLADPPLMVSNFRLGHNQRDCVDGCACAWEDCTEKAGCQHLLFIRGLSSDDVFFPCAHALRMSLFAFDWPHVIKAPFKKAEIPSWLRFLV